MANSCSQRLEARIPNRSLGHRSALTESIETLTTCLARPIATWVSSSSRDEELNHTHHHIDSILCQLFFRLCGLAHFTLGLAVDNPGAPGPFPFFTNREAARERDMLHMPRSELPRASHRTELNIFRSGGKDVTIPTRRA